MHADWLALFLRPRTLTEQSYSQWAQQAGQFGCGVLKENDLYYKLQMRKVEQLFKDSLAERAPGEKEAAETSLNCETGISYL